MPIVFRTPSTLCDKRKQPPTSNLPNHFCAQTFIDTGLQSRQMEANQSIDGPWGRPSNQGPANLVQIDPRNCRLPADRTPSSGSFYGTRGSKMHWHYSHQCHKFAWSSGSQVRIHILDTFGMVLTGFILGSDVCFPEWLCYLIRATAIVDVCIEIQA